MNVPSNAAGVDAFAVWRGINPGEMQLIVHHQR